MSETQILVQNTVKRLEGATWSLTQRIRLAKTVMDAVRIYTNRGPLVPGWTKSLVHGAERTAQMQLFNTLHARVNELITRQLSNQVLSRDEKRFYALNTLRNCRLVLPGTAHALEDYLNDRPNPFVTQPTQGSAAQSGPFSGGMTI